MPTTSFILGYLLPPDAVNLGRLVFDVQFPDQDFFDTGEESAIKSVVTQRAEDFSYSSSNASASRLNVILSNLMSGGHGSETSFKIDLSSSLCVTRQLQNSGLFFAQLCADSKARSWLEGALKRRQDVFLVTGTKTVVDAQIGVAESKAKSSETNVQVPASLLANAAGIPVPGGVLDAGADAYRSADISEQAKFVASGEQLFAVQYRKLRVSWFSTRNVNNVSLKPTNRWEVYIGGRGEEDENEVVDMQVGDYMEDDDLEDDSEVLDANGEIYLHCPSA
ncbi:hypothetical protein F4808DRAFT_438593 [Astrocystis sublimbata]|nr:hypothetical protein F4808DRAFT_438593 [Astrocystis sublimbata]